MRRYALVAGMGLTERALLAYLPDNYRIEGFVVERLASERGADPSFHERGCASSLGPADRLCAVISGEDDGFGGWTLDRYVIPRLRSGSFGCQEIDLSHPALKAIPAGSPS